MRVFFFRQNSRNYFRSHDGTFRVVRGKIPCGYKIRQYCDVSEEIREGLLFLKLSQKPEEEPAEKPERKRRKRPPMKVVEGEPLICKICEREITDIHPYFHNERGVEIDRYICCECHERAVRQSVKKGTPNKDRPSRLWDYFGDDKAKLGYKRNARGNVVDSEDSLQLTAFWSGLTIHHKYSSPRQYITLKNNLESRFFNSTDDRKGFLELLTIGEENGDHASKKLRLFSNEIYRTAKALTLDRNLTELLDPDDIFSGCASALIKANPATKAEARNALKEWSKRFRRDLRKAKKMMIPENIPHTSDVNIWRNVNANITCLQDLGYGLEEIFVAVGFVEPEKRDFTIRTIDKKTILLVQSSGHPFSTGCYVVRISDSRGLFLRLVKLCFGVPDRTVSRLQDHSVWSLVDRIEDGKSGRHISKFESGELVF